MVHEQGAIGELLQCFFSECERRFRFLEQSCGYSYISGLVDYRDNYKIIRPYHNQEVDGRFLALTRYELGHSAIEILFGEEHFFLEGYVYYDPIQRFEFSEVLAAAKKDDTEIAGEWGLADVGMIERTIEKISKSLKDNLGYYTRSDEKILNRAAIIRNKRMEQAIRKHFQKQIQDACLRAAKAFVNKEYVYVVELLQPFAEYLAAGDLKKLRLAEKYLAH